MWIKKNWLCKILIKGRICFVDYLTGYEVVNLMLGVDILNSRTSDSDGKQNIVISNKYFQIELNEL